LALDFLPGGGDGELSPPLGMEFLRVFGLFGLFCLGDQLLLCIENLLIKGRSFVIRLFQGAFAVKGSSISWEANN
jgi:hypothetical protein